MSRITGLFGIALDRLNLPVKLAYQAEKVVRIAAHPINYRRRADVGRTIVRDTPWASFIDRRKGYALFGPETLPGVNRVVEVCQGIYGDFLSGNTERQEGVRKDFFVNILEEDALEDYPEILEFVLSNPVIEAATAYLNAVPILRGVGIYYSRNNESIESSQLFHTDYDDFRQVKCFINVEGVDQDGGPFTLLPADTSLRVRKRLNHGWRDRRLTDREVFEYCSPNELVTLAGPAGSGGMVDTSNCLHFGSRVRGKDRVVFMFQYTTYPNVGVDNVAYSGQEGLPLYEFPTTRYVHDPLRLAVLTPRINRLDAEAKRVTRQ